VREVVVVAVSAVANSFSNVFAHPNTKTGRAAFHSTTRPADSSISLRADVPDSGTA
jgi:hypothetical protein